MDLQTIGIIGGADGPTAIFISGDPVGFVVMSIVGIVCIGTIIGVAIRMYRKRKNKDK